LPCKNETALVLGGLLLRVFVAGRERTSRDKDDVEQSGHAAFEHRRVRADDEVGAGSERQADERIIDAEFYLRRCREQKRRERDT